MMRLTDQQIEILINEPKVLPSNYREDLKCKDKTGHKGVELNIIGKNGSQFRLILRQKRYNGRHGEHTNIIEKETFGAFHIHLATERYQSLGAKEDAYAEATDRYDNIHTALGCMLKDCQFIYPENDQMALL